MLHAIVSLAILASQAPDALSRGERLLSDGDDSVATYTAAIAALDEAAAVPEPAKAALAHARRAEAFLRIGDLSSGEKAKLAWYDKARVAAKQGTALNPKCAPCWFWVGGGTGRWAETKGILEGLFLLDEVRGAFLTALKIDPGYHDARLSLGKIEEAVPAFAGGSTARAEKHFRDVIAADPHFTRAHLDLGELMLRLGRKDEAAACAKRVLAETAPRFPGEHRKWDLKRAKRLLSDAG